MANPNTRPPHAFWKRHMSWVTTRQNLTLHEERQPFVRTFNTRTRHENSLLFSCCSLRLCWIAFILTINPRVLEAAWHLDVLEFTYLLYRYQNCVNEVANNVKIQCSAYIFLYKYVYVQWTPLKVKLQPQDPQTITFYSFMMSANVSKHLWLLILAHDKCLTAL